MQTMLMALAGLMLVGMLPASASARCERRYRDLALPEYDRLVTVYHYQHLSCGSAARIGSAVADRYERGLPLADYPPAPPGLVSGQGRTSPCTLAATGPTHVA